MPSGSALMAAFNIVVFMISYLSVVLLVAIARTIKFPDNVASGLSYIAIGVVIALSNFYTTASELGMSDSIVGKVGPIIHGFLGSSGVLVIVLGLFDLFAARKKAALEQASHGPN